MRPQRTIVGFLVITLCGCRQAYQPPPPDCEVLPVTIGASTMEKLPQVRMSEEQKAAFAQRIQQCAGFRANSLELNFARIMVAHARSDSDMVISTWKAVCSRRPSQPLLECIKQDIEDSGFGGAEMGNQRETIAAHFILADSAYETFKTPEFADLRADALIRANPKAGLDFVKEQRATMSVERKRQACTAVFPTGTPFADYEECVRSLGVKVR